MPATSAILNAERVTESRRFTVSLDDVSEAEWNELLPRFADANIYQTWAYGAVCWGEKQLSHLLLRRDAEVVAAAQLRIVRVPLLNKDRKSTRLNSSHGYI